MFAEACPTPFQLTGVAPSKISSEAQVSLRHTGRMLVSCDVSPRQKLGCILLLAWREFFVYFTFQVRFLCCNVVECTSDQYY